MEAPVDWSARLRKLDAAEWAPVVEAASGLPGPRANLRLVAAAAAIAGAREIDALLRSGSEFATMCAAAAIARRAADPQERARARDLACDGRWRVREGVAIGLQLWGDVEPNAMAEVATMWARDAHPLVQRAAVAAICEPRLLTSPREAARAVAVCATATESLRSLSADRRRDPDVRTLRQTLGYGWSVAVASDPAPGLAVFHALALDDPDVAWIVRENRAKKRLAVLLTPSPPHEHA